MMYPYVNYPDGTEVTFSNIYTDDNGQEYLIVCFERPTENGFDTVIFELPSYDIVKKDGNYSEKEIETFKKVVEKGAAFFFETARGGIQSA